MQNVVMGDDSEFSFQNSTAAKVAGQAVFQGGRLGILVSAIATATGTGPARCRGTVRYTRLTGGGTAWTKGASVHFDVANNRMTTTPTTDTVPAGVAAEATTDGATVGYVILNVRPPAATVATFSNPPTQAECNALRTALINAGYLATA